MSHRAIPCSCSTRDRRSPACSSFLPDPRGSLNKTRRARPPRPFPEGGAGHETPFFVGLAACRRLQRRTEGAVSSSVIHLHGLSRLDRLWECRSWQQLLQDING